MVKKDEKECEEAEYVKFGPVEACVRRLQRTSVGMNAKEGGSFVWRLA